MSPMMRFCTPLEFRLSGETGPARPIERNQGCRQVPFFDSREINVLVLGLRRIQQWVWKKITLT